jgi:type II secretory pathway pseudopilin PulG
MLVVIGIIVILAALALPVIFKVWKSGQSIKGAADLQTIGTGLEAYKAEYGEYPRVPVYPTADQNVRKGAGFATLTLALLAPYGNGVVDSSPTTLDANDPPVFSSGKAYKAGEAVRDTGTVGAQTWVALRDTGAQPNDSSRDWLRFDVNDQSDGPGTRVRAGGAKRGPYLQPDKVRVRGLAILDGWDNPILYFPAAPGKPNPQMVRGYIESPSVNPSKPLFSADENFEVFRRTSTETDQVVLRRIQQMFGDYDADGRITSPPAAGAPTESLLPTGAYVLWSAGPDGLFGPNGDTTNAAEAQRRVQKCDDVTNFK